MTLSTAVSRGPFCDCSVKPPALLRQPRGDARQEIWRDRHVVFPSLFDSRAVEPLTTFLTRTPAPSLVPVLTVQNHELARHGWMEHVWIGVSDAKPNPSLVDHQPCRGPGRPLDSWTSQPPSPSCPVPALPPWRMAPPDLAETSVGSGRRASGNQPRAGLGSPVQWRGAPQRAPLHVWQKCQRPLRHASKDASLPGNPGRFISEPIFIIRRVKAPRCRTKQAARSGEDRRPAVYPPASQRACPGSQ